MLLCAELCRPMGPSGPEPGLFGLRGWTYVPEEVTQEEVRERECRTCHVVQLLFTSFFEIGHLCTAVWSFINDIIRLHDGVPHERCTQAFR